jgi:Protein of unknown function (DUF2523)
MKLGTWLLSLVAPAFGRLLTSLGFSVVTITGFTVAVSTVRDGWINSVNSLPADILNVFLLAGGGIGGGLILGAIATRVAITTILQSTKILGVNPG